MLRVNRTANGFVLGQLPGSPPAKVRLARLFKTLSHAEDPAAQKTVRCVFMTNIVFSFAKTDNPLVACRAFYLDGTRIAHNAVSVFLPTPLGFPPVINLLVTQC